MHPINLSYGTFGIQYLLPFNYDQISCASQTIGFCMLVILKVFILAWYANMNTFIRNVVTSRFENKNLKFCTIKRNYRKV
jgi:hypothetical protein